jgi:hypothetical protein
MREEPQAATSHTTKSPLNEDPLPPRSFKDRKPDYLRSELQQIFGSVQLDITLKGFEAMDREETVAKTQILANSMDCLVYKACDKREEAERQEFLERAHRAFKVLGRGDFENAFPLIGSMGLKSEKDIDSLYPK